MSDPLYDSRFPDRPQHPDFWRLSECILQSDGATEDHDVRDIVGDFVDPESLTYMAKQRVGIFLQITNTEWNPVLAALLEGAFVDGFLLGAKFENHGGRREG